MGPHIYQPYGDRAPGDDFRVDLRGLGLKELA